MARYNLSKYFSGIAFKYLSAVEINPIKSNQHEMNGISLFKKVMGEARQSFKTRFIYLDNSEEDCFSSDGFMTWYDARERHPTRSEYRFYYETNEVMNMAAAGDLLMVGLRPEGTVVVIVAKAGTVAENQLIWLLGKPDNKKGFNVNLDTKGKKVGFVERFILEQIGIEVYTEVDISLLDVMIKKFGNSFPSTKIFSEFSRETLPFQDSYDPDYVILQWLEREESLFRMFEKYLLEKQIINGFKDVDEFIKLAISVINRRKSRVGHSFENHLEQIFTDVGLIFSSQMVTENKSKPDFVFPNIDAYNYFTDDSVVEEFVTVLGVKHTCKDRWRQVLAEADRVKRKYIITVEPSISTSQTDEMRINSVQLIVPTEILNSYTRDQQKWLINLCDFIQMVREKQERWSNLSRI